MKFIKYCLLCLFPFSLVATEYSPWFTPPFEFQYRMSYLYDQEDKVQTPKGSFSEPTNEYTFQFSLGVTPWPNWNIETELFLTRNSQIPFSYQSANLTIRYAWMDDVYGDCVSLVTGVTLAFPGERYIFDTGFRYHGNINAEFHATIGKEWAKGDEWVSHLFLLGGYGIANRGKGWLHGLCVWEYQFLPSCVIGLFSEAANGLGNQSIDPSVPFPGYALINHQNVDVGSYLNYDIPYIGTLTLLGWYNVYAHNFVEYYWGAGVSLLIPFSIL